MAGTLSVTNIQGLASSATPTVVEVSSGHELHTNTLKGTTTAGSIAIQGEGSNTTNLQQGLLKHWCHFHMNTATVDDSFNNSSITDQGTGQFTMNLTSSMASAGNDLIMGANMWASGTYYRDCGFRSDTRLATNTYDANASLGGGSFYDVVRFSIGRAGDLA